MTGRCWGIVGGGTSCVATENQRTVGNNASKEMTSAAVEIPLCFFARLLRAELAV
jgi:hypothetical protein